MNAIGTQRRFADEIVSALRAVAGTGPAPLHEPSFGGNERRYLEECLETTLVSSVGPFVDRFETEIAACTGSKFAVAVVNGTAALHVALKLAGVNPGDEVIVPALSFVATANAVTYCGAIPHFADSEFRTLGMDARKLRHYLTAYSEQRGKHCFNRNTGRVIRVLVPMHTFGHPVDLEGLLAVARDFNLAVIEDAAESLGSDYDGRHTGTFGLMGALSFNGNKIITTGGGGAILTQDADLARRARHLTTTAKVPHAWEYRHDEVGFNYRMPNLNAALGCAQLEQLPVRLEAKRKLFQRYQAAFAPLSGVELFAEPERCKSNYWLQTLLLDETHANERDAVLAATNEAGLMTRPAWTLLPELPPYENCPRMDLSGARSLAQRLINVPSSADLA